MNSDTSTFMPCISLWQPWAAMIITANPFINSSSPDTPVSPIKEYETRGWQPTSAGRKLRGRILVHAAKKWDSTNSIIFNRQPFTKYHKVLQPLCFGAIIGSVEIIDVITTEKWCYENFNDDEHAFGDYRAGRYAWKLVNPVKFDQPIQYRGQQSIWPIPSEIIPEQYRFLNPTYRPFFKK